MAVRTRITLAFAVMMAAVLAVAGAFASAHMRTELWGAVDGGLRPRVDELARDAAEDAADIGTPDGIIDPTEPIAQVLRADGSVLESTVGHMPIVDVRRPSAVDRTLVVDGRSHDTRLIARRATTGIVVVVGTVVDDERAAIAALDRMLLVGGPVVLAVASFAVWLLAGAALRPVDRMRREAEALAFGRGAARLPVPSTRDELARLASTLNDMLTRIEAAVEHERRFIDDASHDLRTPLAVLRSELELAAAPGRTREELQAAVRSALEESERLSTLAEHLLLLARADRGQLVAAPAPTDLVALANDVCATLRPQAALRGITVTVDAPSPVVGDVDATLVRRAISNVVENAIGHCADGGRVTARIRSGAPMVTITVTDTGPGFDPGVLENAFERFTRADAARARGGTGLGLSIVRAIADAHHGSATARNGDTGAEVVISLPA